MPALSTADFKALEGAGKSFSDVYGTGGTIEDQWAWSHSGSGGGSHIAGFEAYDEFFNERRLHNAPELRAALDQYGYYDAASDPKRRIYYVPDDKKALIPGPSYVSGHKDFFADWGPGFVLAGAAALTGIGAAISAASSAGAGAAAAGTTTAASSTGAGLGGGITATSAGTAGGMSSMGALGNGITATSTAGGMSSIGALGNGITVGSGIGAGVGAGFAGAGAAGMSLFDVAKTGYQAVNTASSINRLINPPGAGSLSTARQPAASPFIGYAAMPQPVAADYGNSNPLAALLGGEGNQTDWLTLLLLGAVVVALAR